MAGALRPSPFLRLAVAAVLIPGSALGQAPLADPTRPPAPAGAVAPGAAMAPATGGLQTVIRRPGRRPLAVIDGSTVALGGKLGERTLVRLSDTEAVLQGPGGREVLRLTPGAEKKPPTPPARADRPR
ncbi:hypothetical protein GALL_107740 [mine drainage metagenome]|uniref:MSHA biogenesis protein MshK n=1 Tax=mine drainage metagenome TaxID=410659 RepID=A0A1J5SFH3_9ZZZZ